MTYDLCGQVSQFAKLCGGSLTALYEVMTGQVPAVLGDIPVPAADGLRDLVHARDGGLQEAGRALHSQEHRDHGLVVPGAVAFLSHFSPLSAQKPVMAILPYKQSI